MPATLTTTLRNRLSGLAQQLPELPPDLWAELTGVIDEVGTLESALIGSNPGDHSQVIGEDRAGFVRECTLRLIDVSTSQGEFSSQVTRTLWWFWRLRGQRLEADSLSGLIAENKRLRGLLAEQESQVSKADEQCRKIIHTLTPSSGASA